MQTMDAMFPDMPVNSGLEKFLAVVSDGIAKAAQPLMSLSFLILPVALAVGIKLFQWLGPFAAIAAVLLPVAGLFAAESILSERTILPLTGDSLAPYTTGKPVCNLSFVIPFLILVQCVCGTVTIVWPTLEVACSGSQQVTVPYINHAVWSMHPLRDTLCM